MKEELIDAHLGVTPDGKNHLREFHSAVCSQCPTTFVNFKITKSEFDKFKKLLMNSEEKIPTSREFAERYYDLMLDHYGSLQGLAEEFIKFAKLHVEAALKAAAEKAETKEEGGWNTDGTMYLSNRRIDEKSILTAYSLENIK